MKKFGAYFFLLTLPLYILDQVTKIWVLRRFRDPDVFGFEEIEVIPNFFWLHRLHNTGVAFGQFNGGQYSNLIFGGISVLAFFLILWMWKSQSFPTAMGKTSAALLISGIMGNVTDRLWHGYVVDFLRFDLKVMMWPSFNVADACICVAAALLFLSSFQKIPAAEKENTSTAESK
jgi:signal peptidase II